MSARTVWPPIAFPGTDMLLWPDDRPAPVLPAGKAGIAVRIRSKAGDPAPYPKLFTVGVDDRPLWWGLGRMIAVVEPGEHLVEVRGMRAADTARQVRVAAGEIAELEFWTPRASATSKVRGILVPAPARRRPGTGRYLVLGYLVAFTLLILTSIANLRPDGRGFAALVAVPIAVALLAIWWKRRGDARYRVAASVEAAEAGRDGPGGWFLGDGEPPARLADDGHGVLVVTGALTRDYTWNGRRFINHMPATNVNAWMPWPDLTIDGEPRPFSWHSWCYRLTPGPHEITVAVRAPESAADRFAGDRATHRVTVTAGQVTRLDVGVTGRVEVRSASLDPEAPSEITGFSATVSCTT
ncbi:hypothetical protein [Actinoplanes awajinensis]|uniref:Uncharacterized protein n=1 Tax=Actinoplanes awajinensis subsp. mycoplanecinus TaxID=135947 RepID=A0A0X3V6Y3_9ACTN|nr:hypothetical protein [Actinoplanes awajinensis]KUL40563.1 hypothetical protein ADL15_06110 [Actinoplanes awajinensis subsp. mycoplanecinus]